MFLPSHFKFKNFLTIFFRFSPLPSLLHEIFSSPISPPNFRIVLFSFVIGKVSTAACETPLSCNFDVTRFFCGEIYLLHRHLMLFSRLHFYELVNDAFIVLQNGILLDIGFKNTCSSLFLNDYF